MTELTEALAEVDGLLAGINYLEKLEPESEEAHSPPARSDNTANSLPPNSAQSSWFGHLTLDLPQLDASRSEEQSKIETRHLRNILNDKLANSNDNSRQVPRKSQWATLRSLRKASMYHYNQFAKVTADSTSADIRKLRKSYVTSKNMLEMGILTFRDVLHGRTPTTLMDIFAFASLSYVISKTLHSNGHIPESDILSGILDWRAAILDEKERSTFDEVAKRLWPEAKEIMHFFPIERKEPSPETAGLRRDGSKMGCTPSSMLQGVLDAGSLRLDGEHIASREDPLLSWDYEYSYSLSRAHPAYVHTAKTSIFTPLIQLYHLISLQWRKIWKKRLLIWKPKMNPIILRLRKSTKSAVQPSCDAISIKPALGRHSCQNRSNALPKIKKKPSFIISIE
jgi:hypothetical protein